MRQLRVQMRIGWLMVAVAIVALLLAWLDPILVVALVGLALVGVIPVTTVAPGSRVRIAAWVVSLYPAMVPVLCRACELYLIDYGTSLSLRRPERLPSRWSPSNDMGNAVLHEQAYHQSAITP